MAVRNIQDGALGGMSERRGLAPGPEHLGIFVLIDVSSQTPEGGSRAVACASRFDTAALVQSPLAETPLFVGRAVSAFARDRTKFDFTGKAGGSADAISDSIVGFL